MPEKNTIRCSYCNRGRNEVKALVPNKDKSSLICGICIKEAAEAITKAEAEASKKKEGDRAKLPLPKEIVAKLDDYVIGQDLAKTTISAAVYKHYKRRELEAQGQSLPEGLEIQKSNILVTGPSGCGKTQVARTIAKILNVPFHIADATKLTQAGYVGDDVDTILQGLLEKADWNVERAQWGIVVIDEIDKIARKSGGTSSGYRDVNGEGVQQALLKLVEGGEVTIAKGVGARLVDPTQQTTINIDTTNILFICMGSFDGIQDVVRKRVNKNTSLGFGGEGKKKVSDRKVYESLSEDDILEFGIIPELAGRLPILTGVLQLTVDELVRILTEPKDALIKQEVFLYEMDGVELIFDPESLQAIAKKAKERKTGARALRGIVANLMLKYDMDTPGSDIRRIRITEDYVNGIAEEPIVERGDVSEEASEEGHARQVQVSEG